MSNEIDFVFLKNDLECVQENSLDPMCYEFTKKSFLAFKNDHEFLGPLKEIGIYSVPLKDVVSNSNQRVVLRKMSSFTLAKSGKNKNTPSVYIGYMNGNTLGKVYQIMYDFFSQQFDYEDKVTYGEFLKISISKCVHVIMIYAVDHIHLKKIRVNFIQIMIKKQKLK